MPIVAMILMHHVDIVCYLNYEWYVLQDIADKLC